jgi:hypothetical protein
LQVLADLTTRELLANAISANEENVRDRRMASDDPVALIAGIPIGGW